VNKKRRVAACDTWERRLNEFQHEMIRCAVRLCPCLSHASLPLSNNVMVPGPEVKAVDKAYSDVLEELKAYLDPLQETFEQQSNYKKQTTQVCLFRDLSLNLSVLIVFYSQVISERKEHEWVLRLCDKSHIRASEADEEKGTG
jgi:hypothetical protein